MRVMQRRLCVFFGAGPTRYAIDAVRVKEVTRASDNGVLTLAEGLGSGDLSALLGGDAEPEVQAGVVMATTPPFALKVKRVDGVFDAGPCPRWPVQGRLVPLISPAIGAALEFEDRLVFELEPDGVARGLPKQLKPLDRQLRSAESALVFTVQGERLGVPLHHVVQVIEAGAHFNRAPNAGSFLGVALHRAELCPVFTVGPLGLVQPFVVLFEVNGDLLGLSASQVEGVRHATSLEGVGVLDVRRMFS